MRYCELHCRTNFSFLDGASHADELASQAKLLGYDALAVTDCNSLSGIVRAHTAAKEVELPLIVGAEILPVDAAPAVVWAADRRGYANLCRLLTAGRRRAEKGNCAIYWEDIVAHSHQLLAGMIAAERTAPTQLRPSDAAPHPSKTQKTSDRHPMPAHSPAPRDSAWWLQQAHRYRELFGDRGYLLASLHRGPDDK